MSHPTIAWVDMRLNLAAATVILIVGAGVLLLSSRRQDGNGKNSRMWIPLVSLITGPVIAFGLWAADVFVLNSEMYLSAFQGDAMTALSRVMIIGASVGVVASVVFAVALNARRSQSETKSSQ